MFPKEHGAYGQLTFPLAAALLVAGPSTAAMAIALAAVAGFLAHEPAAVLLGLRGVRARREQRRRAIVWLIGCGIAGAAAGLTALAILPRTRWWSLAVPAAPAVVLAWAAANGREKTWFGESAAAAAFSLVAVPVAVASGAARGTALAIAVPFAVLFVASTLAVRVVILRVRGGGVNAHAAEATRRATFVFAGATAAALVAGAAAGVWPPVTLGAAAPGLLAATAIAARPPSPARLRSIGWTLVALSFVTGALVVAAAT
jgi:hypothetical protein